MNILDEMCLFVRGQALCQTAAVFGGKSLATQISERFVRQLIDFVLSPSLPLFVRLK